MNVHGGGSVADSVVSVTVVDEAEENDRRRQSQIDVVLAEERAEKDQVCLSERIVICSSYHHFICMLSYRSRIKARMEHSTRTVP